LIGRDFEDMLFLVDHLLKFNESFQEMNEFYKKYSKFALISLFRKQIKGISRYKVLYNQRKGQMKYLRRS
jgi:hypothetical protein